MNQADFDHLMSINQSLFLMTLSNLVDRKDRLGSSAGFYAGWHNVDLIELCLWLSCFLFMFYCINVLIKTIKMSDFFFSWCKEDSIWYKVINSVCLWISLGESVMMSINRILTHIVLPLFCLTVNVCFLLVCWLYWSTHSFSFFHSLDDHDYIIVRLIKRKEIS